MTTQESIESHGLVPTEDALPKIRQMLAHEVELEASGKEREEDLTLLCCVQLFGRGLLEDVLRIWAAKSASFDLSCVVDVQLLCGPGLERTKQFLTSQSGSEAAAALLRITQCEASGDFEEFSPASHLQYYRDYFG